MEICEKEDVVTYAKKLQERGARNVLISMAGDGAVLVAEDGSVYQAEAPKGKLINSVGAGDSMVAGFLAGYLEHGTYVQEVHRPFRKSLRQRQRYLICWRRTKTCFNFAANENYKMCAD